MARVCRLVVVLLHMVQIWLLGLAWATAGEDANCGHGGIVGSRSESINVQDTNFGNVQRTYFLNVPPVPKGQKMPAVLGLHGQGGSGREFASSSTYDSLGNASGWLTIYPDAMTDEPTNNSGWNCGTNNDDSTCVPGTNNTLCHDSCRSLGHCGRCAWTSCYDDVSFISQLLESLTSRLCVDSERIFVLGESNGAMLVHLLIQSKPGLFAKAAPIFGLPLLGYLSGPHFELIKRGITSKHTSVLQLHDRSDVVIPWRGGIDADGWLYESMNRTLGAWAAVHSCDMSTSNTPTPIDGGHLHVRCDTFTDCRNGSVVGMCLYDGGHGDWIGPEGDVLVWNFFNGSWPLQRTIIV